MVLASVVVAAACLPTRSEGDVSRLQDRQDGGESGIVMAVDGGALPASDAGDDPHGVAGVSPPHGPFSGGQHAVVSGTGFSFHPRVWFGATEVAASDVVAISSKKIQVSVPPGTPGTVDVAVQSGDDTSTRRLLSGAYTYDAFYAAPSTGPTSGGTVMAVHGAGTAWDAATKVNVGGMPCGTLTVKSPTELTCVTPPEPPGAKPIVVTGGDGVSTTVLDGFVYSDSDDGFKGGLSGDALAGHLKVLAFDSYTGLPLTGALVIAGDSLDTAVKGKIDTSGVALLTGPSLNQPVTVTVARECTQPSTFVAVPVDTVTMYLDPVKSTDCGSKSGDPPPVGGKPGDWPTLDGQIQFPSTSPEFQGFARGPWSLVPDPKPGEKKVAYLFNMASDPSAGFQLPSQPMVTEDSPGDTGYQFSLSYVPAGNIDLYALVGLLDTSGHFTAFAFGITKGISTKPGVKTVDVAIQIDHTLDQKVTLSLDPPAPGPNGPDRVATAVAVSFGAQGYAVFPGAQKTTFLPLGGDIDVLGLPALTGSLTGATYVSAARAATGGALGLPESVVGKQSTTSASQLVTVDGFVGVPVLATPKAGTIWDDAGITLSQTKGTPADIFVFDVESGGGLVGWTIASPGNKPSFALPDLRKVKGGLVPGAVTITVAAASITTDTPNGQFDYSQLRYRHLAPRGWTAYAEDVFHVSVAP